jgi:formylglycine-generating enzyme required for sulfatase activity
MAWVPAATFAMGSEAFYPEERPVREVAVDGFWMDAHPVTVAQFRRFVKATGYLSWAERAPQAADYPGADPALLVPGSLVFRPTPGPVSLEDWTQWWSWTPGACWQRPEGPGSDTYTRGRHPVVHIAHADALAYAHWAGKTLPTEAEWERAARGGLHRATYAWGEDPDPARHANTWHGQFPWHGYRGTSPTATFAPNAFGLYDLTGNVWEWTTDPWTTPDTTGGSCCHGDQPGAHTPRQVIKGGSHLCSPTYCLRYRPAARQGEPTDSTTSHIGFRCVIRVPNSRGAHDA